MCGCARAGPVVGSSPSLVVKCHGPPGRPPRGVAITEGRWAHVVKPDGATPVCIRITPHVDRGPAHRVWPGAVEDAAPVPSMLRASTQMAAM